MTASLAMNCSEQSKKEAKSGDKKWFIFTTYNSINGHNMVSVAFLMDYSNV